MSEESRRLGSSGVFKAIVMSARKLTRVLSDQDADLPAPAEQLGTEIAQAFVAGRLADVHALGTPGFQRRTQREVFVERWRDAVKDKGPFTGYELSNAGAIDLAYIPGLEDVPQAHFIAFVELVLSSPSVPLDDDKAFTVGVVMLREGDQVRIGAIHAR